MSGLSAGPWPPAFEDGNRQLKSIDDLRKEFEDEFYEIYKSVYSQACNKDSLLIKYPSSNSEYANELVRTSWIMFLKTARN